MDRIGEYKYIWALRHNTFQVERRSFISEEITQQIHLRNLYWNSLSWLPPNIPFKFHLSARWGRSAVCRHTHIRLEQNMPISNPEDLPYNPLVKIFNKIVATNSYVVQCTALSIVTPFIVERIFWRFGENYCFDFSCFPGNESNSLLRNYGSFFQ